MSSIPSSTAHLGGSPSVANSTPRAGGAGVGMDYGRSANGGQMSPLGRVSAGWTGPNRDFSDIDRLVFQEVEALKTSGVKASGVLGQPRGLADNMRKPSIKESRAFAGSG